MSPPLVLLGAEKQAATSIALAWPERHFELVTDQPVVDGWDLPNVRIRAGSPTREKIAGEAVLLCPRWLQAAPQAASNVLNSFRLANVFGHLGQRFAGLIAPVASEPHPGVPNVIKGDRFHRPDGTLVFSTAMAEPIEDPHAAGVLFQPWLEKRRTVLALGRRAPRGLAMGLVLVHAETCARDEWLTAGETLVDDRLVMLTRDMLDHLDHRGLFTAVWVLAADGAPRLTSLRPIPRAALGALRRAGVDLLQEPEGDSVARAGARFVVDLTYTSYQPLAA